MSAKYLNRVTILCGVATAACTAIAPQTTTYAGETGSATIIAQPDGSQWQYALDLTNTSVDGSTVGTFWFSWIPGQSYLASNPTNVFAPTGWEDGPDSQSVGGFEKGASIEWQATTVANDLVAGHVLSGFSFVTPDAPSSVFGNSIYSFGSPPVNPPVLTAFVYSGEPFSDGGQKLLVQVVPEPSTLAISALAVAGTLLLLRPLRPERV